MELSFLVALIDYITLRLNNNRIFGTLLLRFSYFIYVIIHQISAYKSINALF